MQLKPGFHITVSDRDASQSVERRCYWDAYDDMGMFFWWCRLRPRSIADVPVEMRKVEISLTFENVPDASRHVPVDAGTSPSLTTIWKPGLKQFVLSCVKCVEVNCVLSLNGRWAYWRQSMPITAATRMHCSLPVNDIIKCMVYAQSSLHISGFLREFHSFLVNCVLVLF